MCFLQLFTNRHIKMGSEIMQMVSGYEWVCGSVWLPLVITEGWAAVNCSFGFGSTQLLAATMNSPRTNECVMATREYACVCECGGFEPAR